MTDEKILKFPNIKPTSRERKREYERPTLQGVASLYHEKTQKLSFEVEECLNALKKQTEKLEEFTAMDGFNVERFEDFFEVQRKGQTNLSFFPNKNDLVKNQQELLYKAAMPEVNKWLGIVARIRDSYDTWRYEMDELKRKLEALEVRLDPKFKAILMSEYIFPEAFFDSGKWPKRDMVTQLENFMNTIPLNLETYE